MARHQQKHESSTFVCDECKADNCIACLDVLRGYRSQSRALCMCGRVNHPINVERGAASRWGMAITIGDAAKAASITCPACGRTSHNPNDVAEAYCGNCRQWIWGDVRMRFCLFCDMAIDNIDDDSVWKEVRGLVGGQKKDSMVLRANTGRFAHGSCVTKAREGVASDQPSLFEEE